MKLIGALLIVFGLLALASGGYSTIRRDQVLDLGTLQVSTAPKKTPPIAPLAGIAALLGGFSLMVGRSKARVMG